MANNNHDVAGRIDDVFVQCTASSGSAGFNEVLKTFWPILDNTVSMVDLAGVFTMCVSSGGGPETLDLITFAEFFNGIARVKYNSGGDYNERLLKELEDSKGIKIKSDLPLFEMVSEKTVIRTLLKYDLPLRRCFSGFAGQNINVGGGLTWEEVQKLSIGMEVSGFSSFAGAHNLIPSTLTLHKCENLARDVLCQFPLNASGNALHSALLFPQFQLLLCFTAHERQEALSRRGKETRTNASASFARKNLDASQRPLADMLVDLMRDLGVEKIGASKPLDDMSSVDPFDSLPRDSRTMRSSQGGASITYPGKVVMPSQERPENQYTGTINHSRHAQLMRMDNLFEEIEAKVLKMLEPGSDVLTIISGGAGAELDAADRDRASTKLTSKPVVIGDAVPVPAICPEPVEQLLQAALAHHNLGSFEEALKFLEAARMQLEDIARRVEPAPKPPKEEEDEDKEDEDKEEQEGGGVEAPQDGAGAKADAGAAGAGSEAKEASEPEIAVFNVPLDLELYVTLCKGNVYQSCGDDEQSLLHYLDGWDRALADGDRDWEIVCLNSIGTLAYYSLRYDVALICFGAVAAYRQRCYGPQSADTATAWNNEAASMYCLGKRAESRLRFEKSWAVMCKVLGHRAPRSVTAWKNLEKSRRAASSLKSSDGLAMRPDIDRLVVGGTFMVQATLPVDASGKKKKGGGKKKKK